MKNAIHPGLGCKTRAHSCKEAGCLRMFAKIQKGVHDLLNAPPFRTVRTWSNMYWTVYAVHVLEPSKPQLVLDLQQSSFQAAEAAECEVGLALMFAMMADAWRTWQCHFDSWRVMGHF